MSGAAALPEAWCATQEAWAIERQLLFRNAWQIVARLSDLAVPGSYVAGAIAGTGVFALRQTDGSVLGFRNICRHQGMPVLEAGLGRCERLRCRFHGWTYGLNGALIETPPLVPSLSGDPDATRLIRVAAMDHHGFVLLNLDAGASEARMDELAALAGCEPLELNRAVADTNWKREMERILSAGAAT